MYTEAYCSRNCIVKVFNAVSDKEHYEQLCEDLQDLAARTLQVALALGCVCVGGGDGAPRTGWAWSTGTYAQQRLCRPIPSKLLPRRAIHTLIGGLRVALPHLPGAGGDDRRPRAPPGGAGNGGRGAGAAAKCGAVQGEAGQPASQRLASMQWQGGG
jgi:hypothetical protein